MNTEALEATYPWRTGRKVGRTIYAVLGGDPDADLLIGVMDSPEIAANAVQAHNAQRAASRLLGADARVEP